MQPTLKGKLVELRPLRADDFEALFAVAQDPLIWEQHPASDRYKEEVFRNFFREAMECGGAFIVYDAADGQVIGSSRYFGYDEARSEIEIGWTFLARSHWGGRYNREMKELMLRHALGFVVVHYEPAATGRYIISQHRNASHPFAFPARRGHFVPRPFGTNLALELRK